MNLITLNDKVRVGIIFSLKNNDPKDLTPAFTEIPQAIVDLLLIKDYDVLRLSETHCEVIVTVTNENAAILKQLLDTIGVKYNPVDYLVQVVE